jgi:hypothetical protein
MGSYLLVGPFDASVGSSFAHVFDCGEQRRYYLELPDGADVPTLRPTPKLEKEFMWTWLHVLCSSMVWSARILNLQDSNRAKVRDERNRLRIAADRLGIPPFLKAKQNAIHRGAKSERRRAKTIQR